MTTGSEMQVTEVAAPTIAVDSGVAETSAVSPALESTVDSGAASAVTEQAPPVTSLLGEATPESPAEQAAPDASEIPSEEVAETTAEGDGAQTEQAPAPEYDPFTLPEGLTLEGDGLGAFTQLLSQAELAKGDHASMQEFGQKLVDLHLSEMNAYAEKVQQSYQENWKNTLTEWRDKTKADPEIGGNRLETSLQDASRFVREVGGTADQQKAFRQLMEETGLGNHPVMLGFLARGARAIGEGKPIAAQTPVPKKTRAQSLYGS